MVSHFFYRLERAYDQPKISVNALWNSNATEILNLNLSDVQYSGVFIDAENSIYATDQENGKVYVWQKGSPNTIKNIFEDLIRPSSLFVDSHGDMYVADGDQNKRVRKWEKGSNVAKNVIDVDSSCTGLFIDQTKKLYCSMAEDHLVVRVSLESSYKTWTDIAGAGCPGPFPNTLNYPHGIFVDSKLDLYVADTYNDRIQRFALGEPNGRTVAGFGSSINFTLNKPTSIILDGNNALFIVDSHNHRVVRSIPQGFKCIIGCTEKPGETPYKLSYPHSMAFDIDGNILVTDDKNRKLKLFHLIQSSSQGMSACWI